MENIYTGNEAPPATRNAGALLPSRLQGRLQDSLQDGPRDRLQQSLHGIADARSSQDRQIQQTGKIEQTARDRLQGEESSSTEETTVYVGRASFRMTAACDSVREIAEAPEPSPWFSPADEHVLLQSPSDQPVGLATYAPSPLPERGGGGPHAEGHPRRRTRVLPIATALVVGAFATLSAQAIMRGAPSLTAVVQLPGPSLGAAAASLTLPAAVPAAVAHALVAPSTARIEKPQTSSSPTENIARPADSGRRNQHARAQAASRPWFVAPTHPSSGSARGSEMFVASSPRPRRAKRTRASTWVDPFAVPAAPATIKWVDPFAD